MAPKLILGQASMPHNLGNRIAERRVPCKPLLVHTSQHRHHHIRIFSSGLETPLLGVDERFGTGTACGMGSLGEELLIPSITRRSAFVGIPLALFSDALEYCPDQAGGCSA